MANIRHQRSFCSYCGLASISALKFEAIKQRGNSKTRGRRGVAAIIEEEIVSLSIEIKVAIAVATGFVLMVVGAMAQG